VKIARRELQILGAISHGCRGYEEIAGALGLVPVAVESRVSDLCRKAGLGKPKAAVDQIWQDIVEGTTYSPVWNSVDKSELPAPRPVRPQPGSGLTRSDLEILGAIRSGHHTMNDVANALGVTSVPNRLSRLGERAGMSEVKVAGEILGMLVADVVNGTNASGAFTHVYRTELPSPQRHPYCSTEADLEILCAIAQGCGTVSEISAMLQYRRKAVYKKLRSFGTRAGVTGTPVEILNLLVSDVANQTNASGVFARIDRSTLTLPHPEGFRGVGR
jgi:DNA-binding CsgD family transcriptional regulator